MKKIPLGPRGLFVLVDNDVYEWAKDLPIRIVAVGYVGTIKSFLCNGRKSTHTDYLHRRIMNARKNEKVDHINHDKLDCRRENLRIATHAQNMMNQVLQKRKKSSRFKGVCWNKRSGKWMAYIKFNCVMIGLGYFSSEEDAARAYDKKAIELFGEFALTNEMLGLY